MKLPKGTLWGQREGGGAGLRELVQVALTRDFHGYLRIVGHHPAEGKGQGVLVFLDGNCVLGYLSSPRQVSGSQVGPFVVAMSGGAEARLRLYRFNREEVLVVREYVSKHPGFGIDASGLVGVGAAGPTQTQSPVVEEVVGADADGGGGVGVDKVLQDLDRMAAPIEAIEGALDEARQERDRLKGDVVALSRGERAAEHLIEGQKAAARQSAQALESAREALAAAQGQGTKGRPMEALREQVAHLEAQSADLKAREGKLSDLERTFRRVLTSTEQRLKEKEEEIFRRERESKEAQVAHRRREGELEARANELRAWEKRLEGTESAGGSKDGVASLEARVRELEAQLLLAAEGRPAPGQLDLDVTEDLKVLLAALDRLLEHLPPEVVRRFSGSPEFELYERVMAAFEVAKDPNKDLEG